ncbi:P-loop containing nucleoside triphosphate hydrolase protein [Apiospora arundinis]|uniref:P-loop containing nucleoside triphosphate hydrolase protein n=1 Tax=Apiospora arundinis TaxID=335852 RepID=A0ABR2HQ61_9PEZI
MSSDRGKRKIGPFSPFVGDIATVVSRCNNCSHSLAEYLLISNNNNVPQAIASYDKLPSAMRMKHEQDWRAKAGPVSPLAHKTGRMQPQATKFTSQGGLGHIFFDEQAVNSESNNDDEDWDFELPRIPKPRPHLQNVLPDGSDAFSLSLLVGAIQGGEVVERIRNYLVYHRRGDGSELKRKINEPLEGFPAFFYVVETRNPEMIRLWARHGGDVNATYGTLRVPLLGYAIAIGGSFQDDTRAAVATLLSLGASADVIPRAFYDPLEQDLPDSGPAEEDLADLEDANKLWCTPHALLNLSQTLNFCFTTRYHLHLSSLLKGYSGAQRQVVQMRRSEDILGIHYFLIGQTTAATFLIKTMLRYLAMPTKRPIVMMFAGPSGHGKTELAKNFGNLLSLPFHAVDCTTIKYETDMFGPRAPYIGSREGSPLNNFLAEHNGSRSIVFLDEFEKTGNDIRQTLLIPFQDGSYQDRRNLSSVDCRKTIWILATNAFDPTIHDFCRRNKAVIWDPKKMPEAEKLIGGLSKQIRKESEGRFGAPITGRVTVWLPFLTFSPIEQAVVADKYVAEFGGEAMLPVRIANDEARDRLVGDVQLEIRQGYSLCSALAREGYVQELGARSLIAEVDDQVRGPLVDAYLQNLEEIVEDGGTTRCLASVDPDGAIEVSCAVPDTGENGAKN